MMSCCRIGLAGRPVRPSLCAEAKSFPSSPRPGSTSSIRAARRALHTTSSLQSSSTISRVRSFFTTDDPLLKALRRRQEAYRVGEIGNSARKKSDRIEAASLAKAEIRWAVRHVRKLQAGSSSTSKSKVPLSRASRSQLISMAVQMTRHKTPLSYLLGTMPFGSLPQELTVRPPTLLPRPETEYWATQLVDDLIANVPSTGSVRIVDLCTGSGCIALLIAHALREKLGPQGDWTVVACDKSPQAVELAKENALKLGLPLGKKLHMVEADVFDDSHMDKLADLAGGPFDLIVSNPPYIPRREWNQLSEEVRTHEDPAALIGERDITPTSSSIAERAGWLDRNGLAFHQRLADLLYRSSFSRPSGERKLPRLVAEYGKGQHKLIERLHSDLVSPSERVPKIVRLSQHKLVVIGVGNALTHPLTRHSIGQIVLDPLLDSLVEHDRATRQRLRESHAALEAQRKDAITSHTIDLQTRPDWAHPVAGPLGLDASVEYPTKLARLGMSGWSATLPLLVPSPTSASFMYVVEVALYKPSHPMNLSGSALRSFLSSSTPGVESDVLVLQDELDLPFGAVKTKTHGSARGHNGIRDIISKLHVPEPYALTRVRIGIGRPEDAPKNAKQIEAEAGGGWLPRSLTKSGGGGKKSKPVPIDRWVLSRLNPDEMESCTTRSGDGSVAQQVASLTIEWIQQRCQAIAQTLDKRAEGEKGGVTMRKDQFGIYRTIWVY